MKITIYTISDCAFSKKEREYFSAKKLPFEEKNLETHREFLTEMLTLSNNFAGTPVTKIEKDDGQIVVLKGFTPEEFDKTLEMKPVVPQETPPQAIPTEEVSPSNTTPTQPVPAVAETATPTSPMPIIEPTQPADPALTSILADLQTKAEEPVQAQPSMPTEALPPQPPPSPTSTPPIPTPSLPPIPDFPSQ